MGGRLRALGLCLLVVTAGVSAVGATPAGALSVCHVKDDDKCPAALDDAYTVAFGQTLTVAAPGVLANDRGPAHGTQILFGSSDTESSSGAQVVLDARGGFTYTPAAGTPFSGIDDFQYTITDGHGREDTATVDIRVPAVVHDDTYAVKGNTTFSVDAPGVFGNDTAVDRTSVDYDDSVLTGELDFNDDGSFDYTPEHNFGGTETFTYTVSDINGDVDYTGTVTLLVNAPPTVATTGPAAAVTLSTSVPVAWTGHDTDGIDTFDVQQQTAPWNGAFGAWANWQTATAATSGKYTASPGTTNCFRTRATDKAGVVSDWSAPKCTAVPLPASTFAYSAGWSMHGATSTTTTHDARATRQSIRAKQVFLLVTTCKGCGTMEVRWNNTTTFKVNLNTATTVHSHLVRVVSLGTVEAGTLSIIVTSPAGRSVGIDGLAVSRV